MVRSRLKNLPARRLLRSLFLLLLACGPVLATEAIAPQREISLMGSEETIPEWRSLWDDAREMARSEDYVESARLYGQLFKLKDNIEELNWEYCKVLLKIGDSAAAARILAGLLEQNPTRNDYLLAAGHLAEQVGDAARAVHHFGKVFEKNPVGADSDAALAGLVRGLRAQGKRAQALPLLEGLSQRRPEDRALLYTLALDSRDHGRPDRARQLFVRLLDSPEVEDRLIFQAAELFDVPGHEQRRQALWEEYLRRHPEYLPFRVRLAEAYRQQGEFEAALRQYQFLAESVIDSRP
ncbi:MAG TPA: tetratricopeptide repeat protein, partial [Desulforhopalus sp.]|nr:tetratricopeptide repeat protein [Desulforhopalus sp.]